MTYLEQELRSYSFISKFQEVAPNNYDGQWIWNLTKPTDSWMTLEFYKKLGYSDQEIKLRSTLFWQQMFAKSDVSQMLEFLQNLSNQSLYENIIQLTGKQGDVFWIKCTGIVIRDKEKNPIRFIAFLQKQAKVHFFDDYLSLQKQANKLAKIGIWEVNLITKDIYWSQVTKEIYEVPKNYERDFDKVFHFYKNEKDRILLQEKLALLKEGKDFDIRLKLTTHKGHEKWIRTIAIPVIENGKCIRAYGLVQDIDSLTSNYYRLKEQETLFRNMFEYAASAIVQLSLTGDILRANFSFIDLFGYSEEETKGFNIGELTHPDDIKKTLSVVNGMKDGAYYHKTIEKRYLHKSGSIIWAIVSISLVIDSNGDPIYFLSQIVDVTSKKETELKLSSIMRVAKDQNQRMLNFAQIVSHQLRSHTSDMEMLIKLINLEQTQGAKDPYYPMLSQAVSNLSKTIKDLNEVTLIYNEQDKNSESLLVYEYLEQAVQRFKLEERLEDDQFELFDYCDMRINFKKDYLENVLFQIIDNAIKYKSPVRKLELTISKEVHDLYYVLHIADNGLGIDMVKNANKIFKMYQTFHPHEEARGIGLFLIKSQLAAYQHKITVSSSPNQGTCFSIYFRK
ncbi:PAS domain S-box-containing protein [Pustulibacterium marinum]|uniref:histidine kinase n=1 Tax=Pustulibacterium marinum TaxID=1224947 RepID=A0A1I7G9Y9_9FLAO|nr:HAMP domain-containing sensor histidine kinase [Pustulibacterium marinum]SFU45248.1 PAS domain S-box-containing protein [Pustulibacterium marinum]